MKGTKKIGRPRLESTPTDRALCPQHGIIQARGYVGGKDKDGDEVIRWRCPACHSETQVARREGYSLGFSGSIPFCNHRSDKGKCFRPSGHGGEVHQSKVGVWPIHD